MSRAHLGIESQEAIDAVAEFVAGLQAGHDEHDAEILNKQFAADVAWGSPFGAFVHGYDDLHAIHARFAQQAGDRPRFRYEVRHVLPVADDMVVTHVARLALGDDGSPLPPTDQRGAPFSEMAMFVLVRREGRWWLAAGQNTPMRPGGAVAARP
jgi:uncharacterized protein (TIGR02246 family)